MGWPWHFVGLTDEQKHQRRVTLDVYANIAQSSVLTVLLIIQAYFLGLWLAARLAISSKDDVLSSPRIKEERLGHANGIKGWQANARRISWWFGESFEIGGAYFGTRGQVAFAVAWLAWLLFLCVPDTSDDYLHLTKRFGIIAASQLPLHYLLAFKSPLSPLQLLTRCSHETLNTYHQLLGRIIVFLFQLHAAFYLNFFVQSNLLGSKVKELYIICGILGVWIFTAIGTTALAPIRRWSYRVFYASHVTLALAWMPVLWLHVEHIHLYIYETLALFILNAVLRTLHSTKVTATLEMVPGTDLVEINIPIQVSSATSQRFHPGQHAYISLPGHSASRTFRSNPFSVASVPAVDGSIRFYARVLDGNTTQLAREANHTTSKQELSLEGPYGSWNHVDKLLQYDRVLFVAGGVGATFVVPLYRQLLADLSPSSGSYRRQKVSFVWVAKSMADVNWAVPSEEKDRAGFVGRLKVYITRASPDDSSINLREAGYDESTGYAETEEGIEMEQRKNLLSGHGSVGEKGSSELVAYAGRPDFRRVIDQTFSHGRSEKVAVFVCGPGGLNKRLRGEVGTWARRGREVWFWEETFAL